MPPKPEIDINKIILWAILVLLIIVSIIHLSRRLFPPKRTVKIKPKIKPAKKVKIKPSKKKSKVS